MKQNSNTIFSQWNVKFDEFGTFMFSLLHGSNCIFWKDAWWTAMTSDFEIGKKLIRLKTLIITIK
jgi:hypothetical protein